MTDEYWLAHARIYERRGKASEHRCTCGAMAQEWALTRYQDAIHGTRMKRVKDRLVQQNAVWSESPWDYTALCRPCHKLKDHGVAPGAGDRHKRVIKNWYTRRAYYKALGKDAALAGPRPTVEGE